MIIGIGIAFDRSLPNVRFISFQCKYVRAPCLTCLRSIRTDGRTSHLTSSFIFLVGSGFAHEDKTIMTRFGVAGKANVHVDEHTVTDGSITC